MADGSSTAPLSRLIRRVRGEPEQEVRLLSDQPLDDPSGDYFGFAAFATALTEIVDNEATDTPLTVALSAPWGAGKTSVARMMQAQLQERVEGRYGDRPRIACWFNAWEHNDAPHLGAALAANVARTANRRRPWRWRLFAPLPAAMLGPQERWRRLVAIAIAAVLLAAVFTALKATRRVFEDALHLKAALVSGLGWLGLAWLGVLVWRGVFSVARDAARFVDQPGSEAAHGSMANVKEQLGRLISQATRGGRLVIFVDDLERCHAERAVEVFEVASQLLAHEGVVTVLLADMRELSRAAQAAYGGIPEQGSDPGLGQRYLEKLVQLELELPPPATEDMRRLLRGEPAHGPQKDDDGASRTATVESSITSQTIQTSAFTAASLGFFATIIGLLVAAVKGESPIGLWWLTLAIVISAVSAVLGSIVGLYRQRLRSRLRAVAQDVVEAGGTAPGVSPITTSDGVLQSPTAAGSSELEAYAGEVLESLQTISSAEVKQVEQFIERYPPRFPRGAKRMLNHARLLTKIAREREMFGGVPELTPAHLGKWIVLRERFPQLVEQIASRHAALAEREELSEPSIKQLVGNQCSWELTRLMEEPPQLALLVERLIYFQPADGYQDA